MARALKTDHKIWLDTPGKNGKPHNPTDLRRLRPSMNGLKPNWMGEYLENWDLLIK